VRTLYRPVGPKELALIQRSGMRAFPPRLPEQPIFYPVLTRAYAARIARDWNVRDSGAGFVAEFDVDAAHLARFEEHIVGADEHRELWVPAGELEEFNRHIAGPIRIVDAFYRGDYVGPRPTLDLSKEAAMPSLPEREVVLEGKYLRFIRRGRWEYVERTNSSGAVVVAAVTADERLVLIEQFRVPVNATVVELPAGLVGDTPEARSEGEAAAARRELLEETGYAADELEPVLSGPISAGLSTETVTIYVARGARRVGPGGGDGTEDIKVHAVPLAEVEAWLAARRAEGLLVDAKIYAGLNFARRAGR
jgi:ADP-ribose pyrophosphatase